MNKKALITGIGGQDGCFLALYLSRLGYQVYGVDRRKSDSVMDARKVHMHLEANVKLMTGDVTDPDSMRHIIKTVKPDEIYNLAAMSYVKASWDVPVSTFDINARAVVHLLEIIRQECPETKYYQASTSEMFGKVLQTPQTETTPFYPRSPYGVAKLAAHWATVNYRESYGLYASSGILFNHESPLRGLEFVTRKITNTVAKIKLGKAEVLKLGNIDAKRDWGHASDYVRAMYLMLHQEKPSDFIVCTGETHSVKEFVIKAFEAMDLNWEMWVEIDPSNFRPAEVDLLLGDCSKAERELGWKREYTFDSLVESMVKADYDLVVKNM